MVVNFGVHGSPTTMGTLTRGRALSAFQARLPPPCGGQWYWQLAGKPKRSEIVFSMTSFVLTLLPVRTFLERATVHRFGSRPSLFCLSAWLGSLVPPPILFQSISLRRHPGLSFQTPQLWNDLLYARHRRCRVTSTNSHGPR